MFCQKAKPDDSRTDRDVGRRGGFTLTELLVALGLAIIIILITVTAFQQGAGVFSRGEATTRAMNNARAALRFLQQDLEGAFLQPDGDVFRGTPSWCGFVTTPTYAYRYNTTSGQTEERSGVMVYYYLDPAPDQPQYVYNFYRYDFPFNYDAASPNPLWWNFNPKSPPAGDYPSQQVKQICFGVLATADDNGDTYPDPNLYIDDNYDRIETRFKYIYNGQTQPYWNSRQQSGDTRNLDGTTTQRPWQYRRLPDAVVVELFVTDKDGLLDPRQTEGANPFSVKRVIPVGTVATAQ